MRRNKFKRILSIILAFVLTLASFYIATPTTYAADSWNGSIADGFAGGSGTAQEPY